MAGSLANAYSEEPDALIALVRICGDAPRETGGFTRKRAHSQSIGYSARLEDLVHFGYTSYADLFCSIERY